MHEPPSLCEVERFLAERHKGLDFSDALEVQLERDTRKRRVHRYGPRSPTS